MKLVDSVHGNYVHKRRVTVLRDSLVRVLPQNAHVLDIGSGDGLLDSLIQQKRPDLKIEGIDVLVREGTHIPTSEFDGTHIPFPDKHFDVALFVDVLHHTEEPTVLLKEAERVARKCVIIKDHLCENGFDHKVLRFMDRVGNARYGVALPHNYLSRKQWDAAFGASKLKVVQWDTKLPLYPAPASLLFGRGLHFVGELSPNP